LNTYTLDIVVIITFATNPSGSFVASVSDILPAAQWQIHPGSTAAVLHGSSAAG
jgi:hypothetical protein